MPSLSAFGNSNRAASAVTIGRALGAHLGFAPPGRPERDGRSSGSAANDQGAVEPSGAARSVGSGAVSARRRPSPTHPRRVCGCWRQLFRGRWPQAFGGWWCRAAVPPVSASTRRASRRSRLASSSFAAWAMTSGGRKAGHRRVDGPVRRCRVAPWDLSRGRVPTLAAAANPLVPRESR